MKAIAALAALCCAAPLAVAQQVPDRGFSPAIEQPRYAAGQGPVVCVDEAHFNFHTLGESSRPSSAGRSASPWA
jgi:hypothetical protein